MTITSSAPAYIRTRYMRGKCWSLALELNKRTGLALWGLRCPAGEIHHAFVADDDGEFGIDIRGTLPIGQMAEGAAADLVPEKLGEADIEMIRLYPERGDASEARKAVRLYMHGIPARRPGMQLRRQPDTGGMPEP